MPASIPTFVAVLLLLAGSAAIPASACRQYSAEEVARGREEALRRMQAEVLALRDEADLVFVGYLQKLTHHDMTVDDGSASPTIMRAHQASFLHPTEIKGKYPTGLALGFRTNQTRVVVNCQRDMRDSLPGEKDVGQTFLVYAKEGRILRVSRMPERQLMDGRQEAELLRSSR